MPLQVPAEQKAAIDDPNLLHAFDQHSALLCDYTSVVLNLLEKVKANMQLLAQFDKANRSMVQELASLASVSRELDEVYEVIPHLPKLAYDPTDFRAALSSVMRYFEDAYTAREQLMQDVEQFVTDPLVDFHNQLAFRNKSIRKNHERDMDDYDQALSKYFHSIKKKDQRKVSETSSALFRTSETALSSTLNYIDFINQVQSKKDRFMYHKLEKLAELLTKYGYARNLGTANPEQLEKMTRALTFEDAPMTDMIALKSKFSQNFLDPGEKTSDTSVDDQKKLKQGQKCGYLWIRSKKTWTRRFCWTQPSDGVLACLSKPRNANSVAIVAELGSFSVQESDVDDRKFAFEITAGSNTVSLQAETEAELKQWLSALSAIRHRAASISRPLLKAEPFGDRSLTASSSSVAQLKSASATDLAELAKNPPGTDELMVGSLALKEIRPGRRLTNSRDYNNVIWKSTRFSFQRDGKLFQMQETSAGRIEILDVKKSVPNRHYIQAVDESLFNRKYVLVIQTPEKFTYLAASDSIDRNAWLLSLKSVAEGMLIGADKKHYRAYRSLSLRIIEGRGFSSSADPYCEIYFGDERKARTNTRRGAHGDPFWREDFFFEDLPTFRSGITLYVMNQNKLQRDSELGRVVISNSALRPGEVEAWYPIVVNESTSMASAVGGLLSGMTGGSGNSVSNVDHYGDLKLKIKIEEEVVLTLEQYEEYFDLFRNTECALVYDLAQVSSDLEWIAQLLLNIFDAQGLSIPWLKYLIEEEVYSTENMYVLFRGNSILTKAMDCFMKVVCSEYLESTIGSILREICDNKVHCELDPTRLEKNDDLKSHYKKLTSYAAALWESIERAGPMIPRELRILFHHLQRCVLQRFGQSEEKFTIVRYTSVSGFIFLRLFCPAILNPKLFGLTRDFPDQKTTRTLTLLAKTMQCLANLANFGVKEPYMIDMNSFIMDHSNLLTEYIDSISTLPSNPTPLSKHAIDLEKQFSSLHRFIRNNTFELEKLASQHRQCMKPRNDLTGSTTRLDNSSSPALSPSRTIGTAHSGSETNLASLMSGQPMSEAAARRLAKLPRRQDAIQHAIEASEAVEERIHSKLKL